MSGELRELGIRGFRLEAGIELPEVRQAFRLYGRPPDDGTDLVVVFHALTGSSRVEEWWGDVVGPGKALDTGRWTVLCPELLGADGDPTSLPDAVLRGDAAITPRDQARLTARVVGELGVRRVKLATGGSLGGMVALEWAALGARATDAVVAFAAPAAHPAAAVGWNHIRRRAVRAAGAEGLAIARMIGMQTYRTPEELERRFGRDRDERSGFRVASYLRHHGRKLVDRYDPESYLVLLDAMDAHDVGRARGGTSAALAPFPGRLVGVGIPGDRLYREEDVRGWVRASGAEYRTIESVRGHDGFLLETGQVGSILRDALRAGRGDDGSTAPGERPRDSEDGNRGGRGPVRGEGDGPGVGEAVG